MVKQISSSGFNHSISEGLQIESRMAYGSGRYLVKIWFESKIKGLRLADFVQAFENVNEARKSAEYVKKMQGIAACYIVRKQPYRLIERIVCFNDGQNMEYKND